MDLYLTLLQPSPFPVYSTPWTGAIPYLWSALWSFLYFSSTAIHTGTLEKPYKLAGMASYGQLPRARGANRMAVLLMLRNIPTLDSWPRSLLTQTHISLFGRAQPRHLSLCVLTHEVHATGPVCVPLCSHGRRVAAAGRPEADAQNHRCWGCPTSFAKQLHEEQHLHSFMGLILSGLAPTRTVSLGMLQHLWLVNRLPLLPGTLVLPPAQALNKHYSPRQFLLR